MQKLMRVRKSIWAFLAGVVLVGILISPPARAFFADAISFLGTIQWTNNGAASVVQTVDGKGQMTFNGVGNGMHFIVDQSSQPFASANCTVNTGSSDTAGEVTISGGATSACTVTFTQGFTNVPYCVAADTAATTSTVQVAATTGTVVLTLSSSRNDGITWMCLGR